MFKRIIKTSMQLLYVFQAFGLLCLSTQSKLLGWGLDKLMGFDFSIAYKGNIAIYLEIKVKAL